MIVFFLLFQYLSPGYLFQEYFWPVSLEETRDAFIESGLNTCTSDILYKKLSGYNLINNPVLIAYRGVSRAMMADCVINPYKKSEFFKSGKNDIETAMKIEPDNLDIRFVRYMCQNKVPAFLGYNNKEEDIKYIIQKIEKNISVKSDLNFSKKVIEAILTQTEPEGINKIQLELLSQKII